MAGRSGFACSTAAAAPARANLPRSTLCCRSDAGGNWWSRHSQRWLGGAAWLVPWPKQCRHSLGCWCIEEGLVQLLVPPGMRLLQHPKM